MNNDNNNDNNDNNNQHPARERGLRPGAGDHRAAPGRGRRPRGGGAALAAGSPFAVKEASKETTENKHATSK